MEESRTVEGLECPQSQSWPPPASWICHPGTFQKEAASSMHAPLHRIPSSVLGVPVTAEVPGAPALLGSAELGTLTQLRPSPDPVGGDSLQATLPL